MSNGNRPTDVMSEFTELLDWDSLPVGVSSVASEAPPPKPEQKEPERSEGDRLIDFFFPKKPSTYVKCTCGIDASNSDGKHSTWCDKYEKW